MRLFSKSVLSALFILVTLLFTGSHAALAQTTGNFVTVQGNQLFFQGAPIKLKGINFYPKDQPWAYMWSQWDGAAAQKDLSRASELGANTVRILVPYAPVTGWTDKDTGKVDPVYLSELGQMLQIIGNLKMKAIVALFDFYDPLDDTLPQAEVQRRNKLYIDTVVGAFASDDRILAWDLHNEPDQYPSWRDDNRQRDFIAWMAAERDEIKKVDSNHLITVGMSVYNSPFIADDTGEPYPDEPARGLAPADLSDFVSFHSYNAGSIDWQITYIEKHSTKPIVLEETGWTTGPGCTDPTYTESQQTLLYNLMVEGATKHDIAGMLNWQLWDLQPGISQGSGRESNEDYYGLLRRDGTWKPATDVFRNGWPGANNTVQAPLLPSNTTSNLSFTKQPPPPTPTDPTWIPPKYFPETGHYANGFFRDYWNNFGGVEIFGYPITEQRLENGLWVQYFERARFEYHPEYAKTTPNWNKMSAQEKLKLQIQLTRLGADLVTQKTGGKGYSMADPLYLPQGSYFFPQTGQAIVGTIADYWQSHNGLINFGYPLSPQLTEVSKTDGKTYTVQYFERTRLELHPENAGTPYEVQLGLMGKELLTSKGCP